MGVNLRRIKAYRTYNDLGQSEVANELNISVTSYSQKETGNIDFTSKEVGKLANIFGVDPGDLYSNEKQLYKERNE